MKTKYVCRGLISLYVNFHNNRTMWSTNLHVKFCRWGGGEGKRAPKCASTIFKEVFSELRVSLFHIFGNQIIYELEKVTVIDTHN